MSPHLEALVEGSHPLDALIRRIMLNPNSEDLYDCVAHGEALIRTAIFWVYEQISRSRECQYCPVSPIGTHKLYIPSTGGVDPYRSVAYLHRR